MNDQIDIQTQLSEELWLLKRLESRPFPPYHEFTSNELQILRALDAVALYLSNGNPDSVLATFYMSETSTLYLAKNTPLNSQDETILISFLAELRKGAKRFSDLLPFLAQHSAASVNKRLQQFRQSFFKAYHSRKESCGWIHELNALEACRSLLLESEISESFNDSPGALKAFEQIVMIAHTFLRNPSFFQNKYHLPNVEAFRRSVEKIAQYSGANYFIRLWKRNKRKMRYIWVTHTDEEKTRIRQLMLGTWTIGNQRMGACLAQRKYDTDATRNTLQTLLYSKMDIAYPGWRGQDWPISFPITIGVHAEIRLILFLATNIFHPGKPPPLERLYIGCSQMSCLCCSLWIDAFNAATQMQWMTSFGSGNPRLDWAFPAALPGTNNFRIDEVVLGRVRDEVNEILYANIIDTEDP